MTERNAPTDRGEKADGTGASNGWGRPGTIITAVAIATRVLVVDLSLPLGVAAGVPYVALCDQFADGKG
jgi:hypothetical protein